MPEILNMTDQMTALEIVKRANAPEPFKIIELMRLTNEMLIDIPAYECNDGTTNITLQRNIGEAGEHRIYNEGVGSAATQTIPVRDRTSILSVYSKVDAKMLEHSGNIAASRQSEAVGIIKGMGITQAKMLIEADGKNPRHFDGLQVRRNKIGDNVIDAGGTASDDLTSIYIAAVGPDMFHLIYPKGSNSVGITRSDLGLMHVPDSKDPKKMLPMYIENFEAQYGIAVRAPDAVKRICNIPLTIDPEELVDIIIDTRHRLPQGASTYVMYSNVDILVKLDKAARYKGNVVFNTTDPWGKPITSVRDLRCRRMDVISNNETRVV